MTDQTRWGIDQVQLKNKLKSNKKQKEIRDNIAFFVFNCNGFQLNKMKERMEELKHENSNT